MKELIIEAKTENLDAVLDFVAAELEAADCPMKLQMQIAIAVEEIYVNIAHYAYNPEVGGAKIRVAVDDAIVIEFEDQGKPYNPLEKDDPDITTGAEEREIGGLGIFMRKHIKSTALILAVLFVFSAFLTGCKKPNEDKTNQLSSLELFEAAVHDAMIITDDDIFPLVEISKSSKLCSWNDNDQVLMLTYHSYPDSYVAGEEYTLKYGAVWTFTDKEIIKWYQENKSGVTDWELRFKQLIGLPEERTYTHFSAMWVDTEDIIRPGYAWKLSDTVGLASFAEEPGEEYKAWFDGNIIWSYFDSAYPWTRLGYTYDWAAGSGKYGLSEFLAAKDSVTQVEFTLTTEEFVTWLEAQ